MGADSLRPRSREKITTTGRLRSRFGKMRYRTATVRASVPAPIFSRTLTAAAR
jgi:hypothetical protein